MIRFLRAFAWLRWRLLAGSIRAGFNRGRFGAVAEVLRIVVPFLLLAVGILISVPFGLGAYKAGHFLGGMPGEERFGVVLAIRAVLLVVTLSLLISPAVRSVRGTGSSSPRLLLLPIPLRSLHACEFATAAADPWVLVLVPGLLLLPLGLGQVAGLLPALIVFAASLLFLAAMGAIASLVGQLAAIVLRDRRRAELATIGALIAIIAVSIFATSLLHRLDERNDTARRERAEAEAAAAGASPPPLAAPEQTTESAPPEPFPAQPLPAESASAETPEDQHPLKRIAERFPPWLQVLPSEAHARVVLFASQGEHVAALPSLFALLLVSLIGHALSWRLWKHLIEAPEGGARRVRINLERLRLLSVPFVSEPVAALGFATYRTSLRTVRGKLAVVMPSILVAMLIVMNLKLFGSSTVAGFLSDLPASMMLLVGFGIGLLAVQPFVMNQFGCDGSGLTGYFLGPLSEKQLLRGKDLGGLLLLLVSALPCGLVALALLPAGPIAGWLAVVMAGLSAWFLYSPLGACLSVLLPKKANMASIGQAGEAHPGAAVIGTLGAGAALAPGALLVGLGGGLLDPLALAAVSFGWMLICMLIGRLFMTTAAGLLAERRETVLTVASGH